MSRRIPRSRSKQIPGNASCAGFVSEAARRLARLPSVQFFEELRNALTLHIPKLPKPVSGAPPAPGSALPAALMLRTPQSTAPSGTDSLNGSAANSAEQLLPQKNILPLPHPPVHLLCARSAAEKRRQRFSRKPWANSGKRGPIPFDESSFTISARIPAPAF